MKSIIFRTLETTVKKSWIIVTIFVGVLAGVVMNLYLEGVQVDAFDTIVGYAITIQHCIAYFVFGTLIMLMVADTATGLIASEVHEGTFRLLVAKPNTRGQILLAKIIGSILGEIVLAALMIVSYFTTMTLFCEADGRIVDELCPYSISYFVYCLILIVVITAIAVLLSCICKRKIVAFLPIVALVVITVAFFPIYRVFADLAGSASALNALYDTNYQLAVIFKQCVEMAGTIGTTSDSQSIMAYLMNLFVEIVEDRDVTLASRSYVYVENTSLSFQGVIRAYSVLCVICYVSSYLILRKKDV